MALRQELFDGKGSLSVRGRDIFDTMQFDLSRRYDSCHQAWIRNWNAQEFSLTFSFSQSKKQSGRQGRSSDSDFDGDMQMEPPPRHGSTSPHT